MTPAADVHALLARSALAQGEADELEARAIAAARQGNHLVAWVLEQRAGRLLAEARRLALQAQRMLDRQVSQSPDGEGEPSTEVARVVRRACAICAAALSQSPNGGASSITGGR